MSLVVICHSCPDRQRGCAGPCACTLDGADIREHANQRYCPAGRYKLGIGDAIARITHATGIRKVVKVLARGKPCGCKERQLRLNSPPGKW